MNFTKKEIIKQLDEIKNENNVDVEEYIDDTIENDIPTKTLKFINQYKPLKDLGVFNLIYSKRRKTPLFNNIAKRDIDEYEKVICLGSLITQMLCYIKTTHDDVVKHSQLIGINSALDAVSDFANTGSFDKVNIVFNEFSELFRDLFINT